MERVAWADERLDNLSRRVDVGFERIDRDLRDFRTEVRAEIGELRGAMTRVGGGIMVGLVGVFAAVFVSGA